MSRISRGLLVVEDDAALRETIEDVLTEAGFTVVLAADGLEASDLLSNGLRPCLILCDLHVPLLDGAALVKRVRDDPSLAGTGITIMSGSPEPALDLGCTFIRKPLDLTQLVGLARAHCD